MERSKRPKLWIFYPSSLSPFSGNRTESQAQMLVSHMAHSNVVGGVEWEKVSYES